jgi:hypothetical protein
LSIFHRVQAQAKENKKIRLAGGYTCIPWSLQRLGTVIPGIQKGRYIIVTANSKVGKTQLADFLYLYEPYEFIKTHDTNLKLKIFYFSLEMSKEEKLKQAITHKIYKDTRTIISPEDINSEFASRILSDHAEGLIDKYEQYFEEFEKTVTYIDNIRNPYGIYTYMREYAERNGTYYTKEGKPIPKEDFLNHSTRDKALFSIDRYIPDNPNEYVIVITDHISLLTPEKGDTLHQAMGKYSSNYCLKMRNRWNYTVVNVQQQAAEQEKQQYTNTGRSVINKLRPSPDGLGDNKLTGRDCDLMLGLFAPHRYGLETYPERANSKGYDIVKLGDNYRELSILLNRRGSGFINNHLYFNGAVNFFSELENPNSINYSNYGK